MVWLLYSGHMTVPSTMIRLHILCSQTLRGCSFTILQYTAFHIYVFIVLPCEDVNSIRTEVVLFVVCFLFTILSLEDHGFSARINREYLWKEGRKEEREGGGRQLKFNVVILQGVELGLELEEKRMGRLRTSCKTRLL